MTCQGPPRDALFELKGHVQAFRSSELVSHPVRGCREELIRGVVSAHGTASQHSGQWFGQGFRHGCPTRWPTNDYMDDSTTSSVCGNFDQHLFVAGSDVVPMTGGTSVLLTLPLPRFAADSGSASSARMFAATSSSHVKNLACPAVTSRLKATSYADTRAPAPSARSRDGLGPPTE
jgi:hypothetical protein